MEKNNPQKEFIEQFNAKNKSARKTVFSENSSPMSAVPNLNLLLTYLLATTLPVAQFGLRTIGDLIQKARQIWNMPLCKVEEGEEDLPAAISAVTESVIVEFLQILPLIMGVFEKKFNTRRNELVKMGIGSKQTFVAHAWTLYVRRLRSLKRLIVSREDYIEYLETTISAYITNLPTMMALAEEDATTIAKLVEPNSELSIVSTLHYCFGQCCNKYGARMKAYYADMYYDFEHKSKYETSYEDAYLTFQSFSLQTILSRSNKHAATSDSGKRTLSLRVAGLKTYLSSIVEQELYDAINRNLSTMTAAVSRTVGDKTAALENKDMKDMAEDEFKKAQETPENKIVTFKNALYKLAHLTKMQAEIIDFIYTHGESRPRFIAKALGAEEYVSNITTEKCRARQKIRAFYATDAGKKFFDYYGIR